MVPYVLSDGYTINLTLIPQVLQFLQYDPVPTVPGYTPTVCDLQRRRPTLPTVLPHFTVREIVTEVNIWDNQTVVLGGLISSAINTTKDKVPFLGDLPLVGRLFQSQSKTIVKEEPDDFCDGHDCGPGGQPRAFGRRVAVQPVHHSGAAGGGRPDVSAQPGRRCRRRAAAAK